MWLDFVVPFAVEFVSFDSDRVHFIVCHFPTSLVGFLVQPAMNFKPFVGSRRAYKLDNHLVRLKRNATPVARDVTEQSVFDLIPFARARRIVAHLDDHSQFIRQRLQLEFPQSISVTVAASTVRCDQ